MRLICPNCGAQYEVGEDLIPPAGRDVQCSNCGHTWLETPGASEAEEALLAATSMPGRSPAAEQPAEPEPAADPEHYADAEPEPSPDAAAETGTQPPPDAQAEPVAAQATVAEPKPESEPQADPEPEPQPAEEEEPLVVTDPDDEEDALDPDPQPAAGEGRPLRTVAPGVAEILRQEAEREQAARAAEAAAGIESQPDLGLDQLMADEDRRAEEARKRLAMLRGAAPPQEPQEPLPEETSRPEDAGPQPRRQLLPDIEEINSTLRSSSEHGPTAEAEAVEAEVEQRRGFRLGFGTVLLVAVVLALVYAFAPRIMTTIPQSEPILTPYVATINDGRLWLDLRLQDLLNKMEDGGQGAE